MTRPFRASNEEKRSAEQILSKLESDAALAEVGIADPFAEHRRRRGVHWQTIEEPVDLAGVLHRHAASGLPVVVDCLTLWLSNLMLGGHDIAAAPIRPPRRTPCPDSHR